MSDKYEKLATKIGKLVDSKNKQYGNSFNVSGEFLKLIYPDGIPPNAYTDALCIVRIFDKLKRLGNASNLPVNEGKLDAWQDIVGYGLLGLQKDQPTEQLEEVKEEKVAVKDITELTALELHQLAEKRVKDAWLEAKNAKAHLEDVKEYLKAYPNGGIDTGVVNHREFMLDKSALEEVLSQPTDAPKEETGEEYLARFRGQENRDKIDRMTDAQREEHDKNVRLVEAGKAIALDILARACFDEVPAVHLKDELEQEKEKLKEELEASSLVETHARWEALAAEANKEKLARKGVMELNSAEELSDERKKNVSPERLAEENLALAHLAIEEVKAKSGFEDLMKDMAEADEPRRAQVRAFWDKLEAEQDAKKEESRQKGVQSNILKEIEKAKLKHDAALPFVNEEHSTERHYDATEVARKVVNDLVDDGKCAVCELPVAGRPNKEGGRGVHPGCIAEFYKDRQIVPEDLTLADIGSGGPKCAICQCPFRGPLSKEMLDSFAPMVHEECYRKHFGDSPE